MRHRGKSDRCAVYNRPLVLVGWKSRGSRWRPNARSSTDSQGHICRKNNLRRFALGDRHCQRNQGSAAETTATITAALATAESSSRIAEAEVAKALGYELCKCQFPPTPMLTVGSIDNPEMKLRGPVFECPRCGFNTAGVWNYTRIAPLRT